MRTLLGLLLIIIFAGCKKESVQEAVDYSKKPQLISISIDESSSPIIRIRN